MKLEELTKEIIGAAIEVHKALDPRLLGRATESTEYTENGRETLFLQCSQPLCSLCPLWQGRSRSRKCVNELLPVHDAQLLTYMRLGGSEVGLLINFHVAVLKQGLRRKVL